MTWVELDSGASGSGSPDRDTSVMTSGQENVSPMLRDEFGT